MAKSAEIHLHAHLGDIQLSLRPPTGTDALPEIQPPPPGLFSRLSPGVDLALRISDVGANQETGERAFDIKAAMEIGGRMTTARGTAIVPGWVAWACNHVAREFASAPLNHAY